MFTGIVEAKWEEDCLALKIQLSLTAVKENVDIYLFNYLCKCIYQLGSISIIANCVFVVKSVCCVNAPFTVVFDSIRQENKNYPTHW